MKEILRIMSRAFDGFDGGKISKQHLRMLSSRPNYEIQWMVKIIIMCLSPKCFIVFEYMTALTRQVFLCVKFSSLNH